VGVLAAAAGAPLVYWLLGGADPAAFAGATGYEDLVRIVAGLPSNHSPLYAPVEDPTIGIGVSALSAAAREWLAGPSQARPTGLARSDHRVAGPPCEVLVAATLTGRATHFCQVNPACAAIFLPRESTARSIE
jgi:hypothetical protein